jgi:ATP-binding cassette, subfamily B (MDR/TAP), member 1
LRGEDFEEKRYQSKVYEAMIMSLKYSKFVGLSLGFMMFAMFIDYAIAFYYGSVIIEKNYTNRTYDRPYTVGDVIVIFFAIMIGGFSMGQAAPCIENFEKGKTAGYKVFEVLNRVPNIKNDAKGKTAKNFEGKFEFKDVVFSYPSKPDIQVLKGVSFTI